MRHPGGIDPPARRGRAARQPTPTVTRYGHRRSADAPDAACAATPVHACMSTPIDWYQHHAADVAARYESVPFEQVHGWLVPRLPPAPALVLDVGAGSGRDAAWFAARGDEVIAVEPSAAMREAALRQHRNRPIRWIDDRLPGLEACHRLGLGFDLVLVSAVWMHVPPAERDRAFRKLLTLLRPGGLLAITLRHGPDEHGRGMHPVSADEIERLALRHGAQVERGPEAIDELGRATVRWSHLAVRLPDDGTGAMPLLRHLIVNDPKSSTYKLALLRALCRIADGAAGMARLDGDEHVDLPLGLVGLYWLRLFRPLLDAGLPQSPANRGLQGLGFVGPGYRRAMGLSPLDLRVGAAFDAACAAALHAALREACDTVRTMPAHHSTWPDGRPLFPVTTAGPRRPPAGAWVLDAAALWSFGTLRVPVDVWRCLTRHDAWIEPALVAEWVRLMQGYARGQGRQLPEGAVAAAMAWSDPERDVRDARARALRLLEQGPLHCVWTERRLGPASLDIDHCFPWAVWPCDALWNLLPAHPEVNRRLKRDRVPSDALMLQARARIEHWWRAAYHPDQDRVAPRRFAEEARASLPGLAAEGGALPLEDVFGAVRLQRMRLRQNQQVAEWAR